jgi:Holliday junction DNA helicase RuvA
MSEVDMYYYLDGKLAHVEASFAVIDCGGVGYKCNITASAQRRLPPIGERVKLFTYLHIREDVMDLFGFLDSEEHNCFKMLLGVSGVGPKVALNILSDITPERFALCVVTNDTKALTKAQGVGLKLASRIILELKDKIKSEQFEGKGAALLDGDIPIEGAGNAAEVVRALVVLGYSRQEAVRVTSRLDADSMNLEDAIKAALKLLIKG